MEIYILRHGIAVERGTPGCKKDSDRPLTEEGERKMWQIAKAMLRMDLKFDLILSSPYIRAKRTAEVVAETLGQEVTFTDALLPDANMADHFASPFRAEAVHNTYLTTSGTFTSHIDSALPHNRLILVKNNFMLQTDKNPLLDERIWQAWIRKNDALDKLRFARRLSAISILTVLLAVSALLFWMFRA